MLPKGQPSDTLGSHSYLARGASISPLGNYPGGKAASTLSSVNGTGVAQGTNGARKPGYSGGVSGDHLDQLSNRTTKANRLRTTGKLFDLMSAKSDVDHPLCQECADMLLDALAKQLRDVSRERDCYIDFLRTVNSNIASDAEMEALENDIKLIQEDESTSVQALRDIEEQQKRVREEIALLELESLELDKEEERYICAKRIPSIGLKDSTKLTNAISFWFMIDTGKNATSSSWHCKTFTTSGIASTSNTTTTRGSWRNFTRPMYTTILFVLGTMAISPQSTVSGWVDFQLSMWTGLRSMPHGVRHSCCCIR